jgi:hypothetical protein
MLFEDRPGHVPELEKVSQDCGSRTMFRPETYIYCQRRYSNVLDACPFCARSLHVSSMRRTREHIRESWSDLHGCNY